MVKVNLIQFLFIFDILFLVNSLDNHTLSNYKDITITNLTGIFDLDFDLKIVKCDLNFTFHSNTKGSNIILDSRHLNILSIKELGEEAKNLSYEFGKIDTNLGTPIIIEKEYEENKDFLINIKYETTKEGGAAQFLEKEQSIGKEYPFFFTQSEMTLGRDLIPSQDTPAVKFPFYLGIKVYDPLRGMISGLYQGSEKNDDNTTTYYYYQKIPIPNYLIALAAGDIVEEKVADNISVFTEPSYIKNATKEFEMMPEFLKYATEYMGEYEWGQYNVLVLPHSFPYSGMENPCLTFCSPCLINGDKSLVDLIAHEMIHSWSGNLVTNENWRDFWLNEGITKFLQRKVIARWQNDDYAKMDYMLGLSYIKKYLGVFGEKSTYTTLRPDLDGKLPDAFFSNIPYEKGSNFMYYLEHQVGENVTKEFFQSYFKNFRYKSVDFFDFKNYFIEFCKNSSVDEEILNSLKWDEWVFQPGDCPVPNNFSNIYNDQLQKVLEKFIKEDLDGLDNEFNNMITTAKTVFFLTLEERNIFLTDKQHDFLTNTLKLYENQNYLVTTHYLRLILKETTKFLPHEFESLERYLTSFGVSDFMDGVYRLFYKRDEVKAEEIFNKTKDFYHAIMRDMARKEMDEAKETFPIMTVDLEEKCFFPSNEKKIKIISNEYKDTLKKVNVPEGIFLSLEDKTVKVECILESNEKYCLTKDMVEKDGNYTLIVPERIQQKDYAFKVNNGTNEAQVYTNEIKVDENKTQKEYEIDFGVKENGDNIKITFVAEPDNNVHVMNDDKKLICSLDNVTLECKITKDILNYDETKPNDYKKYELKVVDLCNEIKYSFNVNVKNSKVEPGKDEEGGIGTFAIVLIIIGAILVLAIIAFFVHRAIKRKGNNSENTDLSKGETLMKED